MAILLDERTRVVVQGITGREGEVRTRELMLKYGTKVVAGITPGKGGVVVEGVPVHNSVAEAQEAQGPLDLSVTFVPAPQAAKAALEAMEGGVGVVVLNVDRMPLHHMLGVVAEARERRVRVIGPNTPGLISPGRAVAGMLGGSAENARRVFSRGAVGVLSRSGGMAMTLCYLLTKAGVGQSTCVGIGGDFLLGSSFAELLPLFQADPETEAVLLYGEVGTRMEEEAAELVRRGDFTKPLIALIAGSSARSGARFSHAGTIIEGGRGTYESKVKALRGVGATVVETLGEVGETVRKALRQ